MLHTKHLIVFFYVLVGLSGYVVQTVLFTPPVWTFTLLHIICQCNLPKILYWSNIMSYSPCVNAQLNIYQTSPRLVTSITNCCVPLLLPWLQTILQIFYKCQPNECWNVLDVMISVCMFIIHVWDMFLFCMSFVSVVHIPYTNDFTDTWDML
jgi:hypothetical protein